jgi:hypothetical protein
MHCTHNLGVQDNGAAFWMTNHNLTEQLSVLLLPLQVLGGRG